MREAPTDQKRSVGAVVILRGYPVLPRTHQCDRVNMENEADIWMRENVYKYAFRVLFFETN